MFPSPRVEEMPRDPSAVYHKMQEVLESAECKRVRSHDLRHTFATTSVANGMDIKTLSTILGHISSKTTIDIYLHSTDETKKGKIRKAGTGCISKINDHLYEGRYSPKDAYGKRMARNIYAHTREECEEKLAILIREMKAEIATQKAEIGMTQ